MTTQDAANEVVRAAVEWNAAWNPDAYSEDRRRGHQEILRTLADAERQRSDGDHLKTLLDAHRKLNNALETYLAAKNLPDSAQHPTPNPG